jgi:enamine deaminase RidA (YjgF/YER057c/UK114 family)
MPDIKILNPDSLGKPADFEGQCAQTFANIGAALASQGAGFTNIVEFTTYMVHSQDIPKFMAYRTREPPSCSRAAPTRPTRF